MLPSRREKRFTRNLQTLLYSCSATSQQYPCVNIDRDCAAFQDTKAYDLQVVSVAGLLVVDRSQRACATGPSHIRSADRRASYNENPKRCLEELGRRTSTGARHGLSPTASLRAGIVCVSPPVSGSTSGPRTQGQFTSTGSTCLHRYVRPVMQVQHKS